LAATSWWSELHLGDSRGGDDHRYKEFNGGEPRVK
jgi:hypothetical protein